MTLIWPRKANQGPGPNAEAFQREFQAILSEAGKITRAVFDSYQPVPGRNELQLYYRVTHASAGEVLCHFVLSGHAGTVYKILVVDRGNNLPYPEDHELLPDTPRLKKTGVVEVQLH